MKSALIKLLPAAGIFFFSFTPSQDAPRQGDNIEFTCMKTHKASNQCHYNFTVDGAHYRYVDIGCKFNNKREEVIKKVKDGSLALAKDWKIDCPQPKEKSSKDF